VKSVLPKFGLGIKFLHCEPEDLQRLEEVLAALGEGTPLNAFTPSPQPPATPPAAPPAYDPQRALEAVKSWFGDHDSLTRQEFLGLLRKIAPKAQ